MNIDHDKKLFWVLHTTLIVDNAISSCCFCTTILITSKTTTRVSWLFIQKFSKMYWIEIKSYIKTVLIHFTKYSKIEENQKSFSNNFTYSSSSHHFHQHNLFRCRKPRKYSCILYSRTATIYPDHPILHRRILFNLRKYKFILRIS